MPVKNSDWERTHRLQKGPPHVALKFPWSVCGSVIFSYSDSLGQHFCNYFVGICSNVGFEEQYPRSILTVSKTAKKIRFWRFSYHSCSLAWKTCAQDAIISCHDVVLLKNCRKLREMKQFGQGHVLKPCSRQGSFNLHTGTGWQQTSRGMTVANRSKQHVQLQLCFVGCDWAMQRKALSFLLPRAGTTTAGASAEPNFSSQTIRLLL